MKTLERKINMPTKVKSDWQKLCEECSLATKKNGWTKEDSRELLKKVRKELK